ncbi:gliding motility-associated C-terminal domain-containing protein [Algoriphagus lutimaris]|uniref:MBG domain-containing protein n=1 Tax=Algoriphagus lutimaris TaxID=613197 RepID=UPI00196A48DD|nr:MBG domain-containing protein [Algoriphagus lutimaris]MBN3518964.1 gliding motility-associated C-terminal domain-containing protein [Algoriphagus lutimaris]
MNTFTARYLLLLPFLIGIHIFSQAQTTVTFDEITTASHLSLNGTNTYDNSGVRFQIFSGSNSNANVSSTDNGFNGTKALDDTNLTIGGVTGWKITKVDASDFQFISIWLQNGCNDCSASGTVKAYKDGSQVGSTVNVNFDSGTNGVKNFVANPDFYSVDEIRIEGVDLYVYIDNFTFGSPYTPVDGDPPVVSSISLVGTPLTTATSVNYTVTFSKNAKNVTSDDFDLTTVGTIGTVGAVTGSGTTYNVAVNGIDGEGTIRLDLKAGTDIANDDDVTGTPAFTLGQIHNVGECFVETFETETDESTTFSGNGLTFTLGTGLKIEKRLGFGAGPSNGYIANNFTAGTFSVSSGTEFTMKTIDLFLSDLSNGNNPTGTGTLVITGKKGGVDQFTITKTTGFPTNTAINNGFFTLDFATEGPANYRDTNVDELVFTISDGFIELAIDNMNFCEAAPDVDSDAPAVNSILKVGNPISTATSVDFQVTFDENANNVTIDDFDLIRTGTATGAITGISGSGSVYTLSVTGISGEGSIQVKLLAGTDIADALGNTPPFEYVNGELHLVGACYIENFETFLDGVTSFTSNGVDFTLGGNWAVNVRNGFGINSSDVFVENTGAGTYTLSNSEPVRFSKIAFFLSSEAVSNPNPTDDGTLTIRGIRNGGTVYTITKSSGFPTDFSSNNGFFYIDFSTEGGADNSGTFVDGLEIEMGGSFVYLALDNLQFCSDYSPPTVSLSVTPVSKLEGTTTPNTITATLSQTSTENVTVNLGFSGTATGSGVDYFLSAASITINAGNTSGSITLTNVPDVLYERDETVIIDVTGVINADEDGTQQVTYTITDDDPQPTATLEVLGIYNPITDESGGQAYVRAIIDAVAGTTVTVPLSFSGTASGGGTDYSITGSTITLSAGEIMDSIRVTSQFDGIEEGNETIIIDMGTPTNATEGTPNQVTITIIDEDATPPTGYSVSIDQSVINSVNETAASFTFAGAEVGAIYNYEFTSSGGGTAVSGSGTIATASDQITGIDLSGLGDGLITLSVSLEDGFGNVGSPATDTKNKDTVVPAGYAVAIDLLGESQINVINETIIEFTGTGLEVGATLNYSFTSNGGGTPVSGTEVVSTANQTFNNGGAGYDLLGLSDGIVTLTIYLVDPAGNQGANASNTADKDSNPPTAPSTPDLVAGSDSGISDTDNITNDVTPTFVGTALPNSTITLNSSLDGNVGTIPADGSGNWSITSSTLSSGIHTITATATDLAGNTSPSSPGLLVTIDILAPTPILINGLALQLDVNGNTPTILPTDLLASPITDDYSSSGNIQLALDKTDFNCSDVGINNVTVTATDQAGNSDFAVTNVLVQDLIGPTILAKPSITLNVSAFGTVSLTPAMVDEGSSDACGILSQVLSKTIFDRNDEGINNITYTVTDVNGNPSQVNVEVTIAVVPKVLNITVDAGQSKVYGDANPVYTFTATGFEAGDDENILTGSLSRASGENVGTYAIQLGTLDAGPNYSINFTPANFEITPATLEVTAFAGQRKVYGNVDPTFAFFALGLKNGDSGSIFSGQLTRSPGEDVGFYAISQGTLSAGDNYIINFNSSDFEITPATLDITADAGQTKLYGAADPVFTYSVSGLKNGDTESVISGTLTRIAGEDVGTYAIQPGTIDAGSNYTINFTSADFEITLATLDITAEAGQTKVYGNSDPIFTYQVSGLQNGDTEAVLSGVLARAVGEDVGTYAINQGTLDAGSNYTINFTGADFEITPATLDITADAGQTKVYGDADPVFTYTVNGLKNGDTEAVITGALIRIAGEDVGNYAIQPGTIDAGSNYTINFNSSDFEITPATLDITADAGQTKVYGEADPVFTYSVSGLKNGDTESVISGALIRIAGEDVGLYAIQPGTIDAGSNYTINFISADFEITSATLDITADAGQTKVYGNADPIFTYQVSGLQNGDTEAVLSGLLARAVGEDVGTYAINQGTLDAGSNYTINFTGADFTITPRTLSIVAKPNQAKVYGTADPVFAYTASNFGNGDNTSVLTGALSRVAGEDVGLYAITLGSLDAGSNYIIDFTSADFEIAEKVLDVVADAGQGKVFGTADPVLTYLVSGFENGDDTSVLTGALVRASGENVGSYAISLGTLDAGSNYAINFTGADFTISKAMIVGITLEDGNFVYDGISKSLSISGVVPSGTAVTYTNNSRTDVGSQEVTATISGSNYNSLVLTADLTISPATIIGITLDDGSFVYDGTSKSLSISGDLPTGADVTYTNNSRTEVGSQEVTVTISGSNYTAFDLTAELSITPATLEIVADSGQSKLYGESDPELTYSVAGFGEGDDESILTGTLERTAGESVGMYEILLGSLNAGTNYLIDFTGAEFEIISGDTDGDGVPDEVEEEQGTDPEDPMDYQDLDGDGVPDFVEDEQGTDPSSSGDYLDTDGDKVPDYVEEQQGTDPDDAEDFPDEDGNGIPDYVDDKAVVEFVDQTLEALWGTEVGDLKVPTEVVGITSEGVVVNFPVIWDLNGYDPLVSGTVNYLGTVELPDGVFNPQELQPVLELSVLAKPAPTDVTLSENSFVAIPAVFFQEIGVFTVVDPTDDVHTLSLPEGVQDNDYFEVIDGILFWSSAGRAQGETQFTITLQVIDRGGNVFEKSFQITRQRTPLGQLDVPNTFTPNNDGVNDTWGVPALRYYQGVRISIVEVGGNRVFYTENPDIRWDGTFDGKELPVGAYFWIIEVAETGEVRRGVLNLLKQ